MHYFLCTAVIQVVSCNQVNDFQMNNVNDNFSFIDEQESIELSEF